MRRHVVLDTSKFYTGTTSDVWVDLELDRKKLYKIALQHVYVPFTWYNISYNNNEFSYIVPGIKTEYRTFYITRGNYTVAELNQEIKRRVRELGDNPENIKITETIDKHVTVEVFCGYSVIFDKPESVGFSLGFKWRTTIFGVQTSENEHCLDNEIKICTQFATLAKYTPTLLQRNTMIPSPDLEEKFYALPDLHIRLSVKNSRDKVLNLHGYPVYYVFVIEEHEGELTV